MARRSWLSVVAGTFGNAVLASGVCAAGAQPAFCADGPAFAFRPLLAGRASLTESGFVETRAFGLASFAPELKLPVELVYRSASEESGLFGRGWSCPQFESSAKWEKDGLLWTTPWGERIKFFPKKQKARKDAVKIAPIEAARKGRGLFAPYADWDADTSASDPASARDFTISGKNDLKGWSFSYSNGGLVRIATPNDTVVDFERGKGGELLAVSSRGVRFIELEYTGGLVSAMRVNGIPVAFSYAKGKVDVLPKTLDGKASAATVDFLASVRIASLEPEKFTYAKGYLASASRGDGAEKFVVQTETPAERRQNLKSAEPKSKVAHTGKIAGRLVSDANFTYSYPSKTSVRLVNAEKSAATHDYDAKNGIYRVCDFSGRTTTTYYFMRYDAAYLGKVRKVVDGRGRDVVAFRYDKATGKPVRVTDRLGNNRYLEYDDKGRCTKLTRRADWSLTQEPVRSFGYDRQGRVASVSELDADGRPARTATLAYDNSGRPAKVSDGRRTARIAYSASGFPSEIRDDFGVAATLAYDRYNRLVSSTDSCGVSTVRAYADHGGLAKIERRDGNEVLSLITIGYDALGRPVSATDQDGRTTACDRDALGRIVREKYANDTEVAYAYDKVGRLASVLDENGNEIKFGWDKFGLSSRLTAANQLTSAKRDANGLVASVSASETGRVDRVIRREYDAFDRVVKVEYAKDEVETFEYDKWGRLSEHARGGRKAEYAYDHFGRLVEKREGDAVITYEYNAYGQRTARAVADGKGEAVDEKRTYDRYGRLTEIRSFGSSVKYAYDAKGRVSRQTVDGTPIDYAYTKYGQLAGKFLGGRLNPESSVEYEYSKAGRIVARTANGIRQTYEYDGRGQLLAVKNADGTDAERYAYDKAGNMVKKKILRAGRAGAPRTPQSEDYITTTFTFDGANQLVSSTTDGVTTKYTYDAAGRLVREGTKTYRYGYLDKVLSVTDGKSKFTYGYHVDGQLASADYGDGRAEDFEWDGLALVKRGGERFINEPHIGGGNPVLSSGKTTYFNDMLGTTVGSKAKGKKYSAAALTAFGERLLDNADDSSSAIRSLGEGWFTGKPYVEGLGHAFLFRNYRASLGKWQTADPLGYPDGWNKLGYCRDSVVASVDIFGAYSVGDTIPVSGNQGISDAIMNGTANGGTVNYSLAGFDDNWVFKSEELLYCYWDCGHLYGMYQQNYDYEVWEVLDVTLTFSRDTVISWLLGKSGTVGEIGGWISTILTKIPYIGPTSTVASALGMLREQFKDRDDIYLGQIKRLKSVDPRIVLVSRLIE